MLPTYRHIAVFSVVLLLLYSVIAQRTYATCKFHKIVHSLFYDYGLHV